MPEESLRIGNATADGAPLGRRLQFLEKSLVAALDAADGAALLCSSDGRIVYANDRAKARWEADDAFRQRVWGALQGRREDGATCTTVRSAGVPDHLLITIAAEPPIARLPARLASVAGRWGLTARQRETLGHLVHGESNKQIAERLRCKENTIEVHVSALLRKAGVDCRAALAAKFWAGP